MFGCQRPGTCQQFSSTTKSELACVVSAQLVCAHTKQGPVVHTYFQTTILNIMTNSQFCALCGLGLLLFCLCQAQWQRKENMFMNVLAMFCYSSQGYIERIVFQQTKEKQTAYLNRLTKLLEMPQSSKTFLSVFSGGEIATSSFGPHAPELSELWVPSRDKNRTIPVTCAYTRETSVVQQSLLPVVMHFHCGGMTFGSVKAELDKVRYIAAKSKSVVCSVEYRLAPEHPS